MNGFWNVYIDIDMCNARKCRRILLTPLYKCVVVFCFVDRWQKWKRFFLTTLNRCSFCCFCSTKDQLHYLDRCHLLSLFTIKRILLSIRLLFPQFYFNSQFFCVFSVSQQSLCVASSSRVMRKSLNIT